MNRGKKFHFTPTNINMKRFNLIVATDIQGGIGLDNQLPWHFSSDSSFFLSATSQNIVPNTSNVLIMGRKTWESLGRKNLPGRIFFVLSSRHQQFSALYGTSSTRFYPDLQNAHVSANLLFPLANLWVIGGVAVYQAALGHWACGDIFWTKIHGLFPSEVSLNWEPHRIEWTPLFETLERNRMDDQAYLLSFFRGKRSPSAETQYLEALFDVCREGEERQTRNAKTWSLFNRQWSWDLGDGFPLLTTKKMFWKGIVEELLFFIRGDTDSRTLSEKGIRIWEGNTSREFLDNRGFTDYPEGEMGPMYGYQWRFFGRPWGHGDGGIDQLQNLVEEIKKDPHSRRLLMTNFNPQQVDQGVLYPCHSIITQFYVRKGCLDCSMYQRSGDLFLGIPFNIASLSLLVHIVARLTGLRPGKVILTLGDCHVYEQHLDAVSLQLTRIPQARLPTLQMKAFDTLQEVETMTWEDFTLKGYEPLGTISAPMIA